MAPSASMTLTCMWPLLDVRIGCTAWEYIEVLTSLSRHWVLVSNWTLSACFTYINETKQRKKRTASLQKTYASNKLWWMFSLTNNALFDLSNSSAPSSQLNCLLLCLSILLLVEVWTFNIKLLWALSIYTCSCFAFKPLIRENRINLFGTYLY